MTTPAIILVNPQMGENIGAAARAMKNFGLTELRIVDPRDGWPNPTAGAMARGAEDIIASARAYATLPEAMADCQLVYATTGQLKTLPKTCYSPRQMAAEMQPRLQAGQKVAILFGRERTGLTGEEAALAHSLVTIPTHPAHFSLNLAQAVVVCAYEVWLQAIGEHRALPDLPEPAPWEEVDGFFRHLEQELDAAGFFKTAEQKPTMLRNLRSVFLRAQPTEQEVRTLRGVIASLARQKKH